MNPPRFKPGPHNTAYRPGVPTLAPLYITQQSVSTRIDTFASRRDYILKSIRKLLLVQKSNKTCQLERSYSSTYLLFTQHTFFGASEHSSHNFPCSGRCIFVLYCRYILQVYFILKLTTFLPGGASTISIQRKTKYPPTVKVIFRHDQFINHFVY